MQRMWAERERERKMERSGAENRWSGSGAWKNREEREQEPRRAGAERWAGVTEGVWAVSRNFFITHIFCLVVTQHRHMPYPCVKLSVSSHQAPQSLVASLRQKYINKKPTNYHFVPHKVIYTVFRIRVSSVCENNQLLQNATVKTRGCYVLDANKFWPRPREALASFSYILASWPQQIFMWFKWKINMPMVRNTTVSWTSSAVAKGHYLLKFLIKMTINELIEFCLTDVCFMTIIRYVIWKWYRKFLASASN